MVVDGMRQGGWSMMVDDGEDLDGEVENRQ